MGQIQCCHLQLISAFAFPHYLPATRAAEDHFHCNRCFVCQCCWMGLPLLGYLRSSFAAAVLQWLYILWYSMKLMDAISLSYRPLENLFLNSVFAPPKTNPKAFLSTLLPSSKFFSLFHFHSFFPCCCFASA